MTNKKFTELPTVSNAKLADVIAAVQDAQSVQLTLTQVASLMTSQTVLNNPGNPNGSLAGETYQLCYDTTGNILYVCTTTGTAATAVWTPVAMFSLPVPMGSGGTSASLSPDHGAIVFSNATQLELLGSTATQNQVLLSGSNTDPSWSNAVYPAATVANELLFSSTTNTITGLSTANSAVLRTDASGVPAWSSSMSDGQLLIGDSSGTPKTATLTQGSNITITNGAGSIEIAAATAGINWTVVSGTAQAMAVNNGYITNNAASAITTVDLAASEGVGPSLI